MESAARESNVVFDGSCPHLALASHMRLGTLESPTILYYLLTHAWAHSVNSRSSLLQDRTQIQYPLTTLPSR